MAAGVIGGGGYGAAQQFVLDDPSPPSSERQFRPSGGESPAQHGEGTSNTDYDSGYDTGGNGDEGTSGYDSDFDPGG